MRLRLVTKSPGFSLGVAGPLLIVWWDALPTAGQAHKAGEALAALGRAENRVLVVVILGAGVPPPDADVRKIVAAQVSHLAGRIAGIANVVEGEGFRGAAARAMLTGMALVMRPAYPHKTVATVEDAAVFLAPHSDGRLTVTDIVLASRELRDWQF
ncbi:MAG TPA: hypothetical protein VNO21_09425 [Polyangiaceae bacterium]|nr:hypothetical protein [Polyangiaceae bacterium]